ncbi:MAG TPA: tetratricopeptide repeat protein [Bacteroidales bacterium]|nr:tetratricopeptide repeat protein [Bacteroidales bacterium]
MEEEYKIIKALIEENKNEEAIEKLDDIISKDDKQEMAYYLKGNIHRKKQDWANAINNYVKAIDLNPDSPAVQAKNMCIEVLDFFNTDLYNH